MSYKTLALFAFLVSCGGEGVGGEHNAAANETDEDAKSAATSTLKAAVEREAPENAPMPVVVGGLNEFTWAFFAATRDGENSVSSPLSVSTVWAMLSASAGGATLAELSSTLHFDLAGEDLHAGYNALLQQLVSRNHEGTEEANPQSLRISADLWLPFDATPEPSVLETLARYYGAGVQLSDFASQTELVRQAINEKVSLDTDSLIDELIPKSGLRPDVLAVLTNTVYFRARWASAFGLGEMQFSPIGGEPVTVDAMSGLVFPDYYRGGNFEGFALPYQGQELEMVFVVPDADQFETVAATLTGPWTTDVRERMQPTNMQLTLPKFSVEKDWDLAPTLASMGMPEAFQGSADFDVLHPSLFVNSVIHAAKVTVDEQGTAAAAATAIVTLPPSGPPDAQVTVTVDRPFIFWIRDRATGATLFVGQISNPAT